MTFINFTGWTEKEVLNILKHILIYAKPVANSLFKNYINTEPCINFNDNFTKVNSYCDRNYYLSRNLKESFLNKITNTNEVKEGDFLIIRNNPGTWSSGANGKCPSQKLFPMIVKLKK